MRRPTRYTKSQVLDNIVTTIDTLRRMGDDADYIRKVVAGAAVHWCEPVRQSAKKTRRGRSL